jgi:hypothetical protein
MDFATAGTLVTLDRNFSNHSSTETTPQIWIWWHMGRILRTPTTRCPRLPLLQGPWRPKMLDELTMLISMRTAAASSTLGPRGPDLAPPSGFITANGPYLAFFINTQRPRCEICIVHISIHLNLRPRDQRGLFGYEAGWWCGSCGKGKLGSSLISNLPRNGALGFFVESCN